MMVYLKSVLPVILLGMLSISDGHNSTTIVDKINNGLTNFKDVVESSEAFASDDKMIKNIQKLSGFLGVAGGLLSFALIFLPKQESAELKYMKEKFAEVNMKLDSISSELDKIKELIYLETQRATYIKAASDILFGYHELTFNYFDDLQAETSCSTTTECLRARLAISEKYENYFNVKASLFHVLTGTAESTSVFGEPLLEMVSTRYKCDIRKVNMFANGVIKLAFMGQQVVLAHEKLTGTNTSISSAIKDWSTAVYKLRKKADDIKSDCYQNIDVYMKQDVEDTSYQIDMESNEEAANALKKSLDQKYPWLYWIVISYGAWGGQQHSGFSTFKNAPSIKEKRKRVLQVTAQDRGTYLNQRKELYDALERISNDYIFSRNQVEDADEIKNKFKSELQKTKVWSSLSAFLVLKDVRDLRVAIDNGHSLYYFNDLLTLQYSNKNNEEDRPHTRLRSIKVRFWASLKSVEQINGDSCKKSCSEKGSCKIKPYSSEFYCICEAFFNGEKCEQYDQISLASSVDRMLAITAKIPKLTDIYYEVLDMQNQIGVSLDNVQHAIVSIDNTLEDKFDELGDKLTSEFQWSNLLTQYSDTFSKLTYYLHIFQTLDPSIKDLSLDKAAIALATDVLSHKSIRKWAFELNNFIIGRSDVHLLAHKPFLFMIMDKHKNVACSNTYKEALDNAWRQIMVLQTQMYVMWAQASAILNEPSDNLMSSYQRTVSIQENIMKDSTCDLTIVKSENLACSGGFYTYPALRLINTCPTNYYLVGNSSLTCKSGRSECLQCHCNTAGSSSTECRDQTGQCQCKDKYYGTTCRDRDCEWTSFGPYGSCTKPCGYGGFRYKRRSQAVIQKGNGKGCSGPVSSATSCFNRCCSNDFHCSNKKKCIPSGNKCNYEDDCGDSQDEKDCGIERCEDKYTPYNHVHRGQAIYLDRHHLSCGSSAQVMKMFKLQRSGNRIRYHYKCCTLLSSGVCWSKYITNHYTYDGKPGKGNIVYLDRQTVNCGSNGLLKAFKLQRGQKEGRHYQSWRYYYTCCEMKKKSKLQCYNKSTTYDKDGGGEVYFLARQTVLCDDPSYVLQKFKLSRNSKHNRIRYDLTCCKIKRPS